MANTWVRGITSLFSASSLDSYDGELIYSFPALEYVTIHRMLIDVDFQMTNTTGSWPTMPTVPAVFGIAANTASGAPPTAPASGPITDEASWNRLWDGIIWQPNYIAPTGTSVFDWHEHIDLRPNHKLVGTDYTSLWAGIEVIDNDGSGGTFFADWYAVVYWNILFSPSLS